MERRPAMPSSCLVWDFIEKHPGVLKSWGRPLSSVGASEAFKANLRFGHAQAARAKQISLVTSGLALDFHFTPTRPCCALLGTPVPSACDWR